MCRQTDAQLGQIEAEFESHRTAQPWVTAGVGRPDTFVQAAKHEPVDALQSCCQQTKYAHAWTARCCTPLRPTGGELMKNLRVVAGGQFQRLRARTFGDDLESTL